MYKVHRTKGTICTMYEYIVHSTMYESSSTTFTRCVLSCNLLLHNILWCIYLYIVHTCMCTRYKVQGTRYDVPEESYGSSTHLVISIYIDASAQKSHACTHMCTHACAWLSYTHMRTYTRTHACAARVCMAHIAFIRTLLHACDACMPCHNLSI